jgi:type IV secretory pathway TrbL component
MAVSFTFLSIAFIGLVTFFLPNWNFLKGETVPINRVHKNAIGSRMSNTTEYPSAFADSNTNIKIKTVDEKNGQDNSKLELQSIFI